NLAHRRHPGGAIQPFDDHAVDSAAVGYRDPDRGGSRRASEEAMTDDVGSRGGHVVIIIQNLPLRLDRRGRDEGRAPADAGYRVSVICPKEDAGEPDRHEIDGAMVHSYAAPEGASGLLSYVREFIVCWLQAARLSVRVNRERRFDVLQACNPPVTYWLLGAI